MKLAVFIELQRVELFLIDTRNREQRAARRRYATQLHQILHSRQALLHELVLLGQRRCLDEALLLAALNLDDGGGHLAGQAQQVVDGVDGHAKCGRFSSGARLDRRGLRWRRGNRHAGHDSGFGSRRHPGYHRRGGPGGSR